MSDAIFTESFDSYVCDGESITATVDGFTLTATIHADDAGRLPWEDDGHGPVSDWTRRAKAPGELILASDGGSHRFYDFAAAVKLARADGWGFMPHKVEIAPDKTDRPPYQACGGRVTAGPFAAYDPDNFNAAISAVYAAHRATMTAGEYAKAAALADYAALKAFCDDKWRYVGVAVSVSRQAVELTGDYEHALWGIEANYPGGDNSYLAEVANDYAGEALAAARAKLASLCECDA